MFDHDPWRVDLTMLGDQVVYVMRDVIRGIEELRKLEKKCDEDVQQNGDQVAWQYVELISEKMMEMSKRLVMGSHELRRMLDGRRGEKI